jgi:hypothetical protein
MSARTGIFNYLTGRAMCKVPRPADEAEGLLAAHRAEVIAEFEAYPGELAMLRGVLGMVRTIAKHSDMDELRRVIAEHYADENAAYAEQAEKDTREGESTPDLFQPGRTYAYEASGFTAPELVTVFRVASTTTHPATGAAYAFGWIRKGETTTWTPYAEPADDWPHAWTEITEGGDAR